MCHANPSERSRFIRCIYSLLNATSPAVRYEAAGTLVTLSSAPSAIKGIIHIPLILNLGFQLNIFSLLLEQLLLVATSKLS